jgi:hypothetical protein
MRSRHDELPKSEYEKLLALNGKTFFKNIQPGSKSIRNVVEELLTDHCNHLSTLFLNSASYVIYKWKHKLVKSKLETTDFNSKKFPEDDLFIALGKTISSVVILTLTILQVLITLLFSYLVALQSRMKIRSL